MGRAAIGFSVHLGWAAAVAVAGTKTKVRVVDRRKVVLADEVPESHEPYHKAAEVRGDLAKAREIVRRGRRAIEACARAEVSRLIRDLESEGHDVASAASVQAGGRELTFESILASHAMVHTAEGRLMREALAKASARRGVPVLPIRERELFARGAERLKVSEHEIRKQVGSLGDGLGPPWRADQKKAALIAWLALTGMRG